jgi:hypothetical protein
MYRENIRLIAEQREVHHLVHFTKISNLRQIVKHGLLSRDKLAGPEYLAEASDYYRLDGRADAISVSITRVSGLFEAKRRKNGHTDWVILGLPSQILWTHDCLFSWRNPAKKEIRDHRGWRGGAWAFSKMFDGSKEEREGLELCWPTDPEAEVQVLEPIAPSCILGVIVDRSELVGPVQLVLEHLPGEQRPVFVEAF